MRGRKFNTRRQGRTNLPVPEKEQSSKESTDDLKLGSKIADWPDDALKRVIERLCAPHPDDEK